MLTKEEIIRTLAELVIFTTLFFWMPIVYQIVLSLIFSALVEIVLRRRQNARIGNELTDEAIAKMVENVKTAKKGM